MLNRVRVPLLADIPDGTRRDRLPQRVVRRKHPVIPVPVPPGRWDQRCQAVKKLKRRQLDDTTGPGLRRLPRASRANPVPALVPGQDVANPLRAVARAWHNRQPIERKRRPRAAAACSSELNHLRPAESPCGPPGDIFRYVMETAKVATQAVESRATRGQASFHRGLPRRTRRPGDP